MKKRNFFLVFTATLPLIVTLIILPKLPDKIPAHYGMDGMVTRYGSKFETLIIPIMLIILMLVMMAFSRNERIENATNNVIFFSNLIINVVFNILAYWFLFSSYNSLENIKDNKFDILKAISVMVSLSFIFIGIIMPKCKLNSITGIRTHWTLSSSDVWYKTHKIGSFLFVIFGIGLTIMNLFFLNEIVSLVTTFLLLFILTIILVLYSLLVYKKLNRVKNNKK